MKPGGSTGGGRMFGFGRRRRERLRRQPLSEEVRLVVEASVPLARYLLPPERQRWHGLVQIFLADVRFEGCQGLQVTDRMRLSVAGQACFPLVHLAEVPYPGLRTVLLYPTEFTAYHQWEHPDGTVTEGEDARLGESADRDVIVLSWSDLEAALAGRSRVFVVWHECAHQIDARSGDIDGIPPLPAADAARFEATMRRAFERLERAVHAGRKTLLDPYGATDPVEFFAVAVEAFFSRPVALRRAHRDLYDALAGYFRWDLAARIDASAEP